MDFLVIDFGISSRGAERGNTGSSAFIELIAPQDTPSHGCLMAVTNRIGSDDESLPEKKVLEELKHSFFLTPEYWSIEEALGAGFSAVNKSTYGSCRGQYAIALSALVILGQHWFIRHAGHNRVWLFRQGRLQQLTHDHTQPQINAEARLTAACGLDSELNSEFRSGKLETGDIFLMTTFETHRDLSGGAIISSLLDEFSAANMVSAITQAAIIQNRPELVMALAVRIDNLPKNGIDIGVNRVYPEVRSLPHTGQTVDNFKILKRLRKGRLSHYYNAEDLLDGTKLILKFPDPEYMAQLTLSDCFARDEWLVRRINHTSINGIHDMDRGRRTALYSVMKNIRGENTAQRVRRKNKFSVGEVKLIAKQLLNFLEHIHQQHIFHLDIRPENLVLDKRNKIVHLLGFDGHRIKFWLEQGPQRALEVLNPRYLAPEIFSSGMGDARADIYATGVTLYFLLTGKYPYGKLKSMVSPETGRFRPISKYNKRIPQRFAAAIEKACQLNPEQRYIGAQEFLNELV